MRNKLLLTASVLVASSGAALAQSSPPQPVMPPANQYTNPNAQMQAPATTFAPMSEGRAAAPMERAAPNGGMPAKSRSRANGS